MRKDRAFKRQESQKSTMQKVALSLPKHLQGKKQFWRENTSSAQHFPTLPSFSFLAVTKPGASWVCVTGLDIWGFEKVGARLPRAVSGEEPACSEHRCQQLFFDPWSPCNPTAALPSWDGNRFTRHGGSYWRDPYPRIRWFLENHTKKQMF